MPPKTRRLTIAGKLLASEDRILCGLLLPFGSPGYTNKGRVVAIPGAVKVPQLLAECTSVLEHKGKREDAAVLLSVTATDAGLEARWRALNTLAGNQLLAEAKSGKRTGISVELDDPVISEGHLVHGVLAGNSFPVRPAFTKARLEAEHNGEEVDAEDEGDLDDEMAQLLADWDTTTTSTDSYVYTDEETGEEVTVTTVRKTVDTAVTTETRDGETVEPATDTDETDEEDDDTLEAESMPPAQRNAPPATLVPRTKQPTRPQPKGNKAGQLLADDARPHDVFAQMAKASATDDRQLWAELTDVTRANTLAREQPAWVDELWKGKAYQRRVVPLVNNKPLTNMKVRGWRWTERPRMAAYAGNKAAIPSLGTPKTEQVEANAKRLAGGHDIDRVYTDFGDTEFITAYYEAMTESYAELSDEACAADLIAAATTVDPGEFPADVSEGTSLIVDLALFVLKTGSPQYALVAEDVFRSILLTPQDKRLAYLDHQMSLEDGNLQGPPTFRIVPWENMTPGTALVGAKEAFTYYELGGGTPIRAQALDLARGGEDHAVFGYYATLLHKAAGLALGEMASTATP